MSAQAYEQAVFISYAWGGESEGIVNQINETLQRRGLRIIRDKRDLGYKGSISAFMERRSGWVTTSSSSSATNTCVHRIACLSWQKLQRENEGLRKPDDLLDLIEAKGKEIAEALAKLRK